ncbi:CLUMA_CG006199, isoform A [Clunio marinus]|uniref:CLUMA_CG006199, isoform A n=1 Tax=Clunio marinus TaxID=568069 RepID=A0A1J1HX20_9DIPT|nr:CLUMA_CG006199, isoform A [Clunio marinus]
MSGKLFCIIFLLFLACYQSEATREVQDKFRDENILPDVLDELPDIDLLNITYPSGVKVNLGNVLTPTKVKDEPTVKWNSEDGVFYTLLMTDPDAPSRKNPIRREFRHWLTINIHDSDLNCGETIFQYIGSGPPKDTGLHRYVFLLFKQTKGRLEFDSPYVSDHSSLGRASTSTKDLISKYDLKLVAGNFYQAEYDEYVPILHSQLAGKST